MAKEQNRNTEPKKSGSRAFFLIVIAVALLAIAVYFIFFFHPKNASSGKKDAAATVQPATEFVITPSDQEDEEMFTGALVGAWSSYTSEGVPYTYSFRDDGTVRYKKDGENAIDYTYTFKDGLLTIKSDKKSFVYQCSKDAVGMMAKLNYGQWKTLFSKTAEKIPDFNGCVYIVDDFMYLGTVCLCRDDSLKGFKNDSIEGDWLGAAGDTINFAPDGTYTYVCNAEKNTGKYSVDEEKNTLTITMKKDTVYDQDHWGLDGRVFHIENQYYFKVA